MIGTDTPGITPMIAPSAAPPPTRCSTSFSGVPSSISATAARALCPLTVTSAVPGDAVVPRSRNQSAPLARMAGTLANVSTLFTSTGGSSVSPSAVAISTPPASAVASPSSSIPRRHGGAMRGNGWRPSSTSSRPVSSP